MTKSHEADCSDAAIILLLSEKKDQALSQALTCCYQRTDLQKVAYRTFERYRRKLHSFEWEDIFLEAIQRMIKSLQRKKYEGRAKLASYFGGICQNYCNELLRKSAPPTEQPDDWIMNPEQIVFNEEVENKLKAIIREQSEQCQQFFKYLFFYPEAWSMTDIARELGLSNADTAKATYYRCKKRLVKFIEERPGLGDWLQSFLG